MEIKVLEVGCAACKVLLGRTRQAVEELEIGERVEDVSDISEMAKYEIISLPALVVDGEVKCEGKVPKVEEIKEFLQARK